MLCVVSQIAFLIGLANDLEILSIDRSFHGVAVFGLRVLPVDTHTMDLLRFS